MTTKYKHLTIDVKTSSQVGKVQRNDWQTDEIISENSLNY